MTNTITNLSGGLPEGENLCATLDKDKVTLKNMLAAYNAAKKCGKVSEALEAAMKDALASTEKDTHICRSFHRPVHRAFVRLLDHASVRPRTYAFTHARGHTAIASNRTIEGAVTCLRDRVVERVTERSNDRSSK